MELADVPVKAVIAAFGGASALARAISAPVSTVLSWLRSGRIPAWRHASIVEAAARLRVVLPTDAAAPTSEAA